MDYLATPALVTVAPRATLAGASDSLASVNTAELPNGAQCFVNENRFNYRLDKASTTPATGDTIVAPGSGPGRWFMEGNDALTVIVEIGTARTLSATDIMAHIYYTSAAAVTVTVPANILGNGKSSLHTQAGAGAVSFVAGTGTPAISKPTDRTLTLRTEGSSAALVQRDATEYQLIGDLTTA